MYYSRINIFHVVSANVLILVEFDSLQWMVSSRTDLCMFYLIIFCMQRLISMSILLIHINCVAEGINIYTLLGMSLLFLAKFFCL